MRSSLKNIRGVKLGSSLGEMVGGPLPGRDRRSRLQKKRMRWSEAPVAAAGCSSDRDQRSRLQKRRIRLQKGRMRWQDTPATAINDRGYRRGVCGCRRDVCGGRILQRPRSTIAATERGMRRQMRRMWRQGRILWRSNCARSGGKQPIRQLDSIN
jgi:hypothetical protein